MTAPAPIVAGPEDGPLIIASLESARRVALDTEFHAERRYVPELYLVQLQIEGGPTWIVDPFHERLVADIAPALRATPWVLHAGEQDLRVMSYALGGLPDLVLDTQIAAGLCTTEWPASYASLVQDNLGQALEKGETLSDWSRRPLSPAQLAYAALDVQLLFPLWDALEARLEALGRSELARAACEEARLGASEPPDEADLLRQLPAASALKPAQLLVLQELASWRMDRARATNQPVRTVLSDGVLVDLARRQPANAAALLANRRLPKSVSRDAEELVQRINRARHRPEWAAPQILHRRTPGWRAAQWLQLWIEVVGEDQRFAGGLVLPRSLVERLAIAWPEDRDALRALLGWRDALIGEDLLRVRGGEIALQLVDHDVVRGAPRE